MPVFNVSTTTGYERIPADRFARVDNGDLLFFNGSKDSPPVAHVNDRHFIAVREAGL